MYFQFLIEDRSSEILIHHLMNKLKARYCEKELEYDTKSFKGIGHLKTTGNLLERKTGNLLNDLGMYLRAFDKKLSSLRNSAIVIVLDNDLRDTNTFKKELELLAKKNLTVTDHIFSIAVKEIEAWLLGDVNAIESAYPKIKKSALRYYVQDGLVDTWETLANAVYPGGLKGLRKKAGDSYSEIGRTKMEWADRIGRFMDLEHNSSPSFQYFINNLRDRISHEKE